MSDGGNRYHSRGEGGDKITENTKMIYPTNKQNESEWQSRLYLCPSLPVEPRSSMTPCHRTLFWAALIIPDQLVPCCFSSASVSRLQLFGGRPLFLFPSGFQVRAWLVVLDAGFLRVCPTQPRFLRSIYLVTGSCPSRSHRSSFQIISCHWILEMRLRQVLKNVWIFCCIISAVRNVSHP